MKLFVNRVVAEFNKIFAGTKRVGDSLKLEGKRMSELNVSNAATIATKTESQLNVKSAVLAEKAGLIQGYNGDGSPKVNMDGDPIYFNEGQLNVKNSQQLQGIEPLNLEVDIASRLRYDDTKIINISSLVVNPDLLRVKDSVLLGGKYENQLSVLRSKDADNADLLNDTAQDQLVVEKARITTKMLSDDGNEELNESELRVSSAEFVRKGTENLNIYNMRDYLFATAQAKEVVVTLAASSSTLTTVDGNKSFAEIMTYIKDDSDSEAYKATRLITPDSNTPAKTGEQYKDWVISHNDFKDKVATLNANTADRAVRFGSDTTNYTTSELINHIKTTTTVDEATNASTVQGQTDEDIITTTRQRLLSQSTGTSGLTQLEVDGFFGNNKVKLAVRDIKVLESDNADTITDTDGGTIDVAGIYQKVKDVGEVLSARYIYANATGGQISYERITQDIIDAKADLVDGASSSYKTLKKIETVVKNNKLTVESAVTNEISNREFADSTLQDNIDEETDRIDTILSGADLDKNTFAELRSYTDGLTGDLTTKTTEIGVAPLNIVNITNAIEARVIAFEGATATSSAALQAEVNRVETSVGLSSDGTMSAFSGNYTTASTVVNAINDLDTSLKSEESARISSDSTLNNRLGDITTLTTTNKSNVVDALNEEILRAKTTEGVLSSLPTSAKNNLVASINEINDDLNAEVSARSSADSALDVKIGNNITNISNEISDRKAADGTLSSLTTTTKSNLVAAINEMVTSLSSEASIRSNTDGTLTQLKPAARGNLVEAINANYDSIVLETQQRKAEIGTISLLTTVKTSLVGAINNVDADIGEILDLDTSNKDSVVEALNELHSEHNAEVVRATNAENTLQSNLDTAENTLQTNINTENTRIDQTLSALGFPNALDSNGTVTITGTTYINTNASTNTLYKVLDVLDETVRTHYSTLDTRANNLNTADGVLQSNIDTEEATRIANDNTLQSNINTEETERIDAIDNLSDELNAEVTRATAAEAGITSALNTEKLRASGEESDLQDNIDAEEAERISADGILTTNLNAEISRALSVEAGLRTDLTIESNRALAAEDVLTSAVNTEKGRVDAILSASTADKDSFAEIVSLINSVDTSNDDSFAGYVSTNDARSTTIEGNLSSEISRATGAESTLTTNLSNEISRATGAESTLQTNINTEQSRVSNIVTALGFVDIDNDGVVSFSGTSYLDLKTTLVGAITTLDTNMNEVRSTNATTVVDGLMSLEDKTKLDNIENNSTGDQTGSEIKALYEAEADTNAFTDAEKTKLGNVVNFTDSIITSNTNASMATNYYVDVTNNAITLTLPEVVSNFEKILVHGLKGDFTTNNLTISRHTNATSHTIMGVDDVLTVDTDDETFTMVYINTDWRVL